MYFPQKSDQINKREIYDALMYLEPLFQCSSFMHLLEDACNRTFHRTESLGNRNSTLYELTSMQPPPHLSIHNSYEFGRELVNHNSSLHNPRESDEEIEKLAPHHALSDSMSKAVGNVKLKLLSNSYSMDEEEEICPTCLDGIL